MEQYTRPIGYNRKSHCWYFLVESMKPVFYAVNGLKSWPLVAKELKQKEGWAPVYWIAPPKLEQDITEKFPNTVFHAHYNAHRGIPVSHYIDKPLPPLDSSDLQKYKPYIKTAMQIMNRMEIKNSFHFDERVQHFYDLIRYWKMVVNDFRPSFVVFDSSPHVPAHYVLYLICKENDIGTIILTPTSLPCLIYARSELLSTPNYVGKDDYSNVDSVSLRDSHREHINGISSQDYSSAKPDYMRSPNTISRIDIYKFIRQLSGAIIHNDNKNYLKSPSGSPVDTPSRMEAVYYNIWSHVHKILLKRAYQKLAEQPDLSRSYVYVPLHYQPERTSVPEGGNYGDQYLFIELLSKEIPDNWEIFVKEHPSQFDLNMRGHQGRWKHSYQSLRSISNVRMIYHEANSFDLIDNAEGVATLTGTAGWESVLRKTPALVFGNAWYKDCPGVFDIETRPDLKSCVERIQSGFVPKRQEILNFVFNLNKVGTYAYLSPYSQDRQHISKTQNTAGIVNAIQQELHHQTST